MTISIAPYPKALRCFTIKVKKLKILIKQSFIKITLKKISERTNDKWMNVFVSWTPFFYLNVRSQNNIHLMHGPEGNS